MNSKIFLVDEYFNNETPRGFVEQEREWVYTKYEKHERWGIV